MSHLVTAEYNYPLYSAAIHAEVMNGLLKIFIFHQKIDGISRLHHVFIMWNKAAAITDKTDDFYIEVRSDTA